MAIAVPILIAYGATATGVVAAATATTIAAVASVTLAATGVSAKIDRAASNVFGKDLVKAANIAGAAYMAYSAWGAGAAAGGETLGPAGSAGSVSGEAAAQSLELGDAAMGAAATNAGATDTVMPARGVLMADTSGTIEAPKVQTHSAGQHVQPSPAPAPPSAGSPQSLPGRAATIPGEGITVTTGQQNIGGQTPWYDQARRFWDTSGDHTRAAMIQVGGNTVAGFAQGAQRSRELAEQQRREDEYRRRYTTGSGVLIGGNAFYGPRLPGLPGR